MPGLFSLFNVVKFENNACVSNIDDNLSGTCYSKGECESKGGQAGGNCAQGEMKRKVLKNYVRQNRFIRSSKSQKS